MLGQKPALECPHQTIRSAYVSTVHIFFDRSELFYIFFEVHITKIKTQNNYLTKNYDFMEYSGWI